MRVKGTGGLYACKQIKLSHIRDGHKRDMLLRELQLCKMLDHPNIIKVVEIFHNRNQLHIIMPLCEGGELFDRLYDQPEGRFAEADARALVFKMLKALRYLHDNGIIHRDLKLENFIFVDKSPTSEMKMIDFGFSRTYLSSDRIAAVVGTCYYMAPELLAGDYTFKADMWSLGVIAYMLMTGLCPFSGERGDSSDFGIAQSIRMFARREAKQRQAFREELGAHVSPEAVDFVLRLIVSDEHERYDTLQAMHHPWIQGGKVHGLDGAASGAEGDGTPAEAEAMRTTVGRLREFRRFGALKRAAMLAISFTMDDAQLEQMKAAFEAIDSAHNGVITFPEFSKILAQHGIRDREEVRGYFEALDQDHTQVIKYSEFLAAAVDEKQALTDARLHDAFLRLDVDHSGSISVANLADLLGDKYSKSEIEAAIAAVDVDHSGTIDWPEFLRAVRGY